MAKQGMKRIDRTHTKPRNNQPPVPEIQGKAKHGKAQVAPIIAGTQPPAQKVYHTVPHAKNHSLAEDNLQNDLSRADRQDL